MMSPKRGALAVLVLMTSALEVFAVSSSSPSPSTPVNCVMSPFSCSSDCTKFCGGGTCDAKRTVATEASGGGTCPEKDDTERFGYECNVDACPPAPSATTIIDDTSVIAAANVTVTASLTLPSNAWPETETSAAFVEALKTSAAAAAKVGPKYVAVGSPTRVPSSSGRRLLADTVIVTVAVVFQVGANEATRNTATDHVVAFLTKTKYMTDWVLPADKRSFGSASGTAAIAVSPDAAFACPASQTYETALGLVNERSYAEAARVLNDLVVCAFEEDDEAALGGMADEFNLLGFATRKAENPDTKVSELYYKRALQIDPQHQGAIGYLGELYVQINEFALAREMLDKLKIMCPPPNDCEALGSLRYAMSQSGPSGILEGSFIRDVAWDQCFDLKCSPMNITVGDSLNFVYSAAHDVVKVSDAAAFEACAAGTVVGATSAGAGYQRRFENVGVEYFVCSQGQHCLSGQKMVVNVHTARETPSSGGEAPSYSLSADVDSGSDRKYSAGLCGFAFANVAFAGLVALVA